jgi:hypothetical protein
MKDAACRKKFEDSKRITYSRFYTGDLTEIDKRSVLDACAMAFPKKA